MVLISKCGRNIVLKEQFIYFVENEQYMRYSLIDKSKSAVNIEEYNNVKSKNRYEIFKKNHPNISISDSYICFDELENLYFMFYQESVVYKYDKLGQLIKSYSFFGQFDTLYGIAIEKSSIWCLYSTSHMIRKFSLENLDEEISIGDESESILSYPQHLFVENGYVFVCDMGNKRICRINLVDFTLNEHIKFDEHIWEFYKSNSLEVIRLQSGIYIL
jgi:hypothetical protein